MQRRELADGFELELRRGSASLRRVGPGLVVVTYIGMATEEVIPDIAAALEAEIAAHAPIEFFINAAQLEVYSTQFRKGWTRWLKANRPQIHSVQMLVKSKLVEMGISIVNPLVGNYLVPHSDEASFAQAIDDAVLRVAR